MNSIPTSYPKYINQIQDLGEKTVAQEKYLQAYQEEYNRNQNEWNGLKATMYGVSMLAATTFGSIMLGTAPVSIPLVVASIIAFSAIGATASICTMVYYGVLSDQNAETIRGLPDKFPVKYEPIFNQQQLQRAAMAARYQVQQPPLYFTPLLPTAPL